LAKPSFVMTRLVLFFVSLVLVTANAYEWSSADGQRRFEANFIGLKGDQLLLAGADGKTAPYPLNLFAEGDQLFARRAQATLESSTALGPVAFEIQHPLAEGWLCRMGRKIEDGKNTLMFIGDTFFCLVPDPSRGAARAQHKDQRLYPAGTRTYHAKDSEPAIIQTYSLTLEAAVQAVLAEEKALADNPESKPADVYEPLLEIVTTQGLGV
jgi:hypothetical protein